MGKYIQKYVLTLSVWHINRSPITVSPSPPNFRVFPLDRRGFMKGMMLKFICLFLGLCITSQFLGASEFPLCYILARPLLPTSSQRLTISHLQELNARLNFNDSESWGQLCFEGPLEEGSLVSEVLPDLPSGTILAGHNLAIIVIIILIITQLKTWKLGEVKWLVQGHTTLLQGPRGASKPNRWYLGTSGR